MEFRIRLDARRWFRGIRSDLRAPSGTSAAPDFDAFYFCYVAGLAGMQKRDVPTAETASLVDNFPGPYRSRGRVLVALFLMKELELLGVEITEKSTVHTEISRLVDPSASNFLSDIGVREFNKYGYGGFEVLLDWFSERPRSLESFVRRFRSKVWDVTMPSVG